MKKAAENRTPKMESAEILALKAANEALVARVAFLEAGVKSKSEKKVVRAKPAQSASRPT
jgi:hypothetical protein